MKKIIVTIFLLMSLTALGQRSWKATDLEGYQIKPVSIEKPFKNEYLFEFDIKYKRKSVGFDHDIKLVIGEKILDIQELSVLSSLDNTNQRARVQIKIPRNFSNVEFDGICFVNKKTGEIEKIYNI